MSLAVAMWWGGEAYVGFYDELYRCEMKQLLTETQIMGYVGIVAAP